MTRQSFWHLFNVRFMGGLRLFSLLIGIFLSPSHAEQKVMLVTGGSRGIGAEIVKLAAQEGYAVILHCHKNREKAEELIKQLPGASVNLITEDLSNPEGPPRLWEKAMSWKGSIDIVINNAGILEFTPDRASTQQKQQAWHHTLQVNLLAPADLCEAAIDHFKEKKKTGIIINISSLAAFTGYRLPGAFAYASAKAGLLALTRSIARSYAADHIYAYAITPGFTETDMVKDFQEQYGKEATEKVKSGIPTGQFVTAVEVAHTVITLASGKFPQSTGMTWDLNGASYFH